MYIYIHDNNAKRMSERANTKKAERKKKYIYKLLTGVKSRPVQPLPRSHRHIAPHTSRPIWWLLFSKDFENHISRHNITTPLPGSNANEKKEREANYAKHLQFNQRKPSGYFIFFVLLALMCQTTVPVILANGGKKPKLPSSVRKRERESEWK